MKKFFLYVLGVIPGLVQAHLHAPILGSCYFVLFLVSLNTFFMSGYWFLDQRLQALARIFSGVLGVMIWLYAYRDLHLRLRDRSTAGDSNDPETLSHDNSEER